MATHVVTQMRSHAMPQSHLLVGRRAHRECLVPVGCTVTGMLLLLQSLRMCLWGQGGEMDKMGLPPTQG